MIKLKLVVCICTLSLVSCGNNLTFKKINRLSHKLHKQNIKEIKRDPFNELDSKYYEDISIENENFNYKNRNEIKRNIIDSLNLLSFNKIVILDKYWDSNGLIREQTYFYFNDKIIIGGYEMKDDDVNGAPNIKFVKYIEETNIEYLKKRHDNAVIALDYFNKDNFNSTTGPISFGTFVNFDVTVINEKQISLYRITTDSTGNKIKKL
jgi:hypothetical protein